MDIAIQRLGAETSAPPSLVQSTAVDHDLIRTWAEL